MKNLILITDWIIFIASCGFFLILTLSSIREREMRAAAIAFASFAANAFLWSFIIIFADKLYYINISLIGLGAVSLIISMMRFFPGRSPERDTSKALQYDERDNMFARNNLQHHPDLMKKYHAMRPENESTDQQIHKKPEFGDKEQFFHDPYTAPWFLSAFEYLERSIPLSDGEISEKRKNIDPEKFKPVIRRAAEFYGACDVGFVHLAPHHYYSNRGRHASNFGIPTDQTWKTAIVIVIPMRVKMLKTAPAESVLQESAQKYVEAAKISNIMAGYIRRFGYRARAHNDANYDVLCVPLAVESGLGELGRMGLFMHRVHGPCVRLAVVTTDLELPASPPSDTFHMSEFCKICKKCADNCPSGSISHGNEPCSRNMRHWSIQQEKCFSYWKSMGSDCGLCIGVCPYTKPDTLIHKLVRLYISRNALNQKIALFMDDLLYGRYKKIPKTNPDPVFFQTEP